MAGATVIDLVESFHKQKRELTHSTLDTKESVPTKRVQFKDNLTGWYEDLVIVREVESYKEYNKLDDMKLCSCCKIF